MGDISASASAGRRGSSIHAATENPLRWKTRNAGRGPHSSSRSNEMKASKDPLPEFAVNRINLASPRLGAEAVYATDDFFADKSRLLQDQEAVFIPDKYDEHGKWMDGWES